MYWSTNDAHDRGEPVVAFLVFRGEPFGDRREVDAGLIERHARLELADHGEELALAARRRERVGLQRNPDLIVVGEGEILGHDADDCVRHAVHAQLMPDDAPVAAVPLLPHRVRENRDLLSRRRVLTGAECSAQERPHTDDVEHVGGDPRAGKSLGFLVAAHVDRAGRRRGEIGEGLLLLPIVDEILNRKRLVPDILRRIRAPDRHDAIAVRIREASHQRAIDDAEHRRGEPDAERQCKRGDDGQAGAAKETAPRIADIAKQRLHIDSVVGGGNCTTAFSLRTSPRDARFQCERVSNRVSRAS